MKQNDPVVHFQQLNKILVRAHCSRRRVATAVAIAVVDPTVVAPPKCLCMENEIMASSDPNNITTAQCECVCLCVCMSN